MTIKQIRRGENKVLRDIDERDGRKQERKQTNQERFNALFKEGK
jgi:hypothetical protein